MAGMKKTNDHAEPTRVTLTGLSLTEQKKTTTRKYTCKTKVNNIHVRITHVYER